MAAKQRKKIQPRRDADECKLAKTPRDAPKSEIPTVKCLYSRHVMTQVHQRCVESPQGRRGGRGAGQFEHRANAQSVGKEEKYDRQYHPGKSRMRRRRVGCIGFSFVTPDDGRPDPD